MSYRKGSWLLSESTVWLIVTIVALIVLVIVAKFLIFGGIESAKSRLCYFSVKARATQSFILKPLTSEALPTLCYTREVKVDKKEDVVPTLAEEAELCVKMFEPVLNPKYGLLTDYKTDAIINSHCFVCSVIRIREDVLAEKNLEKFRNNEIIKEMIAKGMLNFLRGYNFYIPQNDEGLNNEGLLLTDYTSLPESFKPNLIDDKKYYDVAVVYMEEDLLEFYGDKIKDVLVDEFVEWVKGESKNSLKRKLFCPEGKKCVKKPVYVYVSPYNQDIWRMCYS